MDVTASVSAYISKMLSSVPGMKCLLLDSQTTSIISLATTQSSLLTSEVYITQRVEAIPVASSSQADSDEMQHLKCIAFVRPSEDSVDAICRELANPRFGSYYLFFSNILRKSIIEKLAQADEFEVVKEVQEYYADYLALHPCLYTAPIPSDNPWGESVNVWNTRSLMRSTEALTALLLSLKKRPIIRYERMSTLARKLAQDVQYSISQEQQLFSFRPSDVPPLLLILDRRNDPVTPLLTQWTYQAMVHELIGIHEGRVKLKASVPNPSQPLGNIKASAAASSDIVLNAASDPFFAANMHCNFGDLGAHLQEFVKAYQVKAGTERSLETIADMKKYVEDYPEFRRLGGNVERHVLLVGELNKRVQSESLFDLSEVEQSLASNESHAADLKSVQDLMSSTKVTDDAKTRLAILYALRYQKYPNNSITQIQLSMKEQGIDDQSISLVNVFLNIAGADQRQDDLFANENFFSRGRSALKGLKGVDNVYTQHSPHLAQTLDQLVKGRLRELSYPYLDSSPLPYQPGRTQDVIIFMIGGTTYEELETVIKFNTTDLGAGSRFLLGGTGVLNSTSYLRQMQSAARQFPPTIYAPQQAMSPNVGYTAVAQGGVAGASSVAAGIGGVLRDGVSRAQTDRFGEAARNLLGKVRKEVEDRL